MSDNDAIAEFSLQIWKSFLCEIIWTKQDRDNRLTFGILELLTKKWSASFSPSIDSSYTSYSRSCLFCHALPTVKLIYYQSNSIKQSNHSYLLKQMYHCSSVCVVIQTYISSHIMFVSITNECLRHLLPFLARNQYTDVRLFLGSIYVFVSMVIV